MTSYVVDHTALIAGLAGFGTESERREMSRLLVDAIDGGPPLAVPAACLAVAAAVRPALLDHLAGLLAEASPGVIELSGLDRTGELDQLRRRPLVPDWAAIHAVLRALQDGSYIVTTSAGAYDDLPVQISPL
jgi:hypothetical protein